ncbi:hypothetical protein [Rhodocyclus tenuis]|uniref:hypothetical protein n=1 Tax=Rhodocyclus tenuis TaxID=1066 RepID=UPI0019053085|nr:hypothetical protein [Rhodocyclus tenuis]MBK1679291.1 hypothetical protein [Rhodocyclus tenuis]
MKPELPPPDSARWTIAIFTARESLETLNACLHAVGAACREDAIIDVVVNGNPGLARRLADEARLPVRCGLPGRACLRIWEIGLGDKANAWNQYIAKIWPGSKITYFIDGYVQPFPDALQRIDTELSAHPTALAATGVPSVGRSAALLREELLSHGGLHGNLFALPRATIEALRHIDFQLPLGLYRTDSTIGAALAYSLHPESCAWDPRGNIHVCADASWSNPTGSIFRWRDLHAQLLRVLRQQRGTLENHAVRHLFSELRLPVGALPRSVNELVDNWRREKRSEFLHLLLVNPIAVALALRDLESKRAAVANPQRSPEAVSAEPLPGSAAPRQ